MKKSGKVAEQKNGTLTYLPSNLAAHSYEKQHEKQVVHVPNKVQDSHVEQLVAVDEGSEQTKRADNSNDKAQADAKRYLKIKDKKNVLETVV